MPQSIESPKSFGITVGLFCGLVCGLQAWRGRPTWALAFGAIGIFLVGAALTVPAVLAAPSRVWWRIARVLAWVNTRLLLSLLFLVVFTPVGTILRLTGRDLLQRSWRRGKPVWIPYPERVRNPKHYEHMS